MNSIGSLEAFTATREEHLVRVRCQTGARIADRDAQDLIEWLDGLVPQRCPPMLVILNGLVSLSPGAFHAFSSRLNVAALALVGPSAVDKVLASFFTVVHEPAYPTRHFDQEPAAVSWLTHTPHDKSGPAH